MRDYLRWILAVIAFFVSWIIFSTFIPWLLLVPFNANVGIVELLLFAALSLFPAFIIARKVYKIQR